MRLKTNFVTIATEGATTDGRKITAEQINQMANNYSIKTYGARIWMEHFRGLFPDSVFKSLGDVVAVRASDNEDGKRVLQAQLEPTEDFVKMNKERQKVFTSIEIDPSFSDTGEAYLVGLGATDTPASLGTDMLKFSANAENSALAGRKVRPENVFSEAVQTDWEFTEVQDDSPSLLEKMRALLSSKDKKDESQFNDFSESLLLLTENHQESAVAITSLQNSLDAQKESFESLKKDFTDLLSKLENNPEQQYRERPPADGGNSDQILTDC